MINKHTMNLIKPIAITAVKTVIMMMIAGVVAVFGVDGICSMYPSLMPLDLVNRALLQIVCIIAGLLIFVFREEIIQFVVGIFQDLTRLVKRFR